MNLFHQKALFPIVLSSFLLLTACSQKTTEEYLISAKLHLEDGNHKAAIVELKNAIKQSPEHPEARLNLGSIYLEQKNFESAIKEFKRALDNGYDEGSVIPSLVKALYLTEGFDEIRSLYYLPNDIEDPAFNETIYYLFRALIESDDLDGAKSLVRDISMKGDVYGFIIKGLLSALDGDGDKAIEHLMVAINLEPENAEALKLLGNIYVSEGMVDHAIEVFDEYLVFYPYDINTTFLLTSYLVKKNKFTEAKQYIDILSDKLKEPPVTLFKLKGLVQASLGDYKSAQESFDRVMHESSNDLRFDLAAGTTSYVLGQYEKAIIYLSRVTEKLPPNHVANKILAASKLQVGEVETAINEVLGMEYINKEDIALLSSASLAAMTVGDMKSASGLIDKLKPVVSEPKDQMRLGMLQISVGSQEGLTNMEQSIDKKPTKEGYRILARAYAVNNKKEKLKALIEPWISHAPDDVEPYLILASIDKQKEQFKSAEGHLKSAYEIDESNTAVLLAMADLYTKSKRPNDALRVTEELLKNHPNHASGLAMQYSLLKDQGRSGDVMSKASKELDKNEENNTLRLTVASMYASEGRFDKSLSIISDLKFNKSTSRSAWALKSKLLVKQGKADELKSHYKDWMDAQPDSRQAVVGALLLHEFKSEYKEGLLLAESFLSEKDDKQVWLMKSYLHSALGQVKRSKSAFENAGDGADKTSMANAIFARNNLHAGKESEARRFALRRYEDTQNTKDLMFLLGLYKKADMEKEYEHTLLGFIENNPDSTASRALIAEHKMRTDRLASIAEYERIISTQPKHVLALNNVAYLYQLEGNNKKALDYARRAFDLLPSNVVIADTLAQSLIGADRVSEAIRIYRRFSIKGNTEVSEDLYMNYVEALLANGQVSLAKRVVESRTLTDEAVVSRLKSIMPLLDKGEL